MEPVEVDRRFHALRIAHVYAALYVGGLQEGGNTMPCSVRMYTYTIIRKSRRDGY